MKLYHISQTEEKGYDTYSDAVVCASSEEEARNIHPNYNLDNPWQSSWHCWCKSPDQVVVKYLGEATEGIEKGIICSSYHAG